MSSGGERRTGREVVHGGRERPVPAPRGALGQALLRAGAARHRDARRARTARRPLPHTTHHTHSYIQGRIQGGHGSHDSNVAVTRTKWITKLNNVFVIFFDTI